MDRWLSSPRVHPDARQAIEALDPAVQKELERAFEAVELQAGEALFTCGDPRDSVYLIVDGQILLTAPGFEDRVLSAGEGVGEIGLASSGPHTTSARALDEARVLHLHRNDFERLCEKYPETMSGLAGFITPVAQETLLARVVCDLLGEQDTAVLGALLSEVERLQLKRGDILIRQGEDMDRMFVVVYGRLRIVAREADGTETTVDEIGPGDTVGERSLLTGDIPSATVYALRDSAVGAITRSLFESLKFMYPEAITRLTRIALRRVQVYAARRAGTTVATVDAPANTHGASVSIFPVGGPRGSVPLADFCRRLTAALPVCWNSLHLNSTRVEDTLGTPGIAQLPAHHPSEPLLSAWLQQQEQNHFCVIYEADDTWTPWTERCLRMADRVLLVGAGDHAPVNTEFDEPLAHGSDSTKTMLVLLQPDGILRPAGTAAWLDHFDVSYHNHVRLGRKADFDSFVRRITGRGLGLVLGGGGARGFAHIGVFRALAECGVDIDLVGGTSMGGILAATFALGLDYQEHLRLAQRLASPLRLFDPTVPVVSFFASAKVTQVLEGIFGDTLIEDLWMPCFCVSSNLTHAVAMVHRRGLLWQAVRASMAIPGIFSPILEEGDLLVDGCVLDNLPIDVMQRLNYSGPIIAVNVFPDVDMLRDYEFGPSISGWQALMSKLNPLARRESPPLIFESLVRVLALNSVHQAKTQRGFADVYIRPAVEKYNILAFGAYAQIAEIGYQSAMQALGEWEELQGREDRRGFSGSGAAGSQPGASITGPLQKTLSDLEDLLDHMG